MNIGFCRMSSCCHNDKPLYLAGELSLPVTVLVCLLSMPVETTFKNFYQNKHFCVTSFRARAVYHKIISHLFSLSFCTVRPKSLNHSTYLRSINCIIKLIPKVNNILNV